MRLRRTLALLVPLCLVAACADGSTGVIASDGPGALDGTLLAGVRVGVDLDTPIGPIRADLAYGEETGQLRLHFSVGFSF